MPGSSAFWLNRACLSVPLVVVLALSGTGCKRGGASHPPPLDDEGPIDTPGTIPGDDDGTTGEDDLPPAPEGWDSLRLGSADPDHGPATGGTEVVLHGNGFGGDMVVSFGARQVDPVDVEVLDGRRVTLHEVYLAGELGRLRDIVQGPDGAIYITTSNCDGRGSCPAEKDRVLRVTRRP